MHTGMFLGVFVDTRVTAPLSDVDKDVLLGFTRFSPWGNSGSREAVTQDIATVKT